MKRETIEEVYRQANLRRFDREGHWCHVTENCILDLIDEVEKLKAEKRIWGSIIQESVNSAQDFKIGFEYIIHSERMVLFKKVTHTTVIETRGMNKDTDEVKHYHFINEKTGRKAVLNGKDLHQSE